MKTLGRINLAKFNDQEEKQQYISVFVLLIQSKQIKGKLS